MSFNLINSTIGENSSKANLLRKKEEFIGLQGNKAYYSLPWL